MRVCSSAEGRHLQKPATFLTRWATTWVRGMATTRLAALPAGYYDDHVNEDGDMDNDLNPEGDGDAAPVDTSDNHNSNV